MGTCPFGAEPTPSVAGLQKWANDLDIPTDIAGILIPNAAVAIAGLGMSLLDYDDLCASNPDPPEPLTLDDFLNEFGTTGMASDLFYTRIIDKTWDWIRYDQFLKNCQCKLPPPAPPPVNCFNVPGPIPVAGNGILDVGTVHIDPALMATWDTAGNGDWGVYTDISISSGAALIGQGVMLEAFNLQGGYTPIQRFSSTWDDEDVCTRVGLQASQPKLANPTQLRLRNLSVSQNTLPFLNGCFCGPRPTPLPKPVQPPVVISVPPVASVCDGNDICDQLTMLSRRVQMIAAQISDLTAIATGTDQLVEASRMTIAAPGEISLAVGIRAVSVELTDFSADAYVSKFGNPRGLMVVGSIRWGDGVGYSQREFIDADRFTSHRKQGATTVAWDLTENTRGILKFLR